MSDMINKDCVVNKFALEIKSLNIAEKMIEIARKYKCINIEELNLIKEDVLGYISDEGLNSDIRMFMSNRDKYADYVLNKEAEKIIGRIKENIAYISKI